jgi:hypothetical protein
LNKIAPTESAFHRFFSDEFGTIRAFLHFACGDFPLFKTLGILLGDSYDYEPNEWREESRKKKTGPKRITTIGIPYANKN